jgi:hypothetical protein
MSMSPFHAETDMPNVSTALIKSAAEIDPLNLAILFIGLVALGVVWIAIILAKGQSGGRKK